MCGRYTLHKKADEIAKHYNIATVPELRDNYNVAPGHIMPVITEDDKGAKHLELMKWGLVPFWAKDPKIGYKLINARDDSIFSKPMWRNVILRKRCLIPADGFYEWLAQPKLPKQPYFIYPKHEDIFSFAGVWDSWKDIEGKEWKTYSIITTTPNKEMTKIHSRMPIILEPDQESSWLAPDKTSREDIEPFMHPYKDNGLEMYKVSSDVNSTANNDEHLIYALS